MKYTTYEKEWGYGTIVFTLVLLIGSIFDLIWGRIPVLLFIGGGIVIFSIIYFR